MAVVPCRQCGGSGENFAYDWVARPTRLETVEVGKDAEFRLGDET